MLLRFRGRWSALLLAAICVPASAQAQTRERAPNVQRESRPAATAERSIAKRLSTVKQRSGGVDEGDRFHGERQEKTLNDVPSGAEDGLRRRPDAQQRECRRTGERVTTEGDRIIRRCVDGWRK